MSEAPQPAPLPELSYQSVNVRISALRQTTWIMLLVVGCLTIVAGLCMGGMMGLALTAFHRMKTSGTSTMATSTVNLIWLWAVILLLVPAAVGAIEIVCSLKIRKHSLAATVVALFLVGINFLLMAGLVVLGVVGLASERRLDDVANGIVGLAVFAIAALLLGAMEILLFKVLSERHAKPTYAS